MRILIAKLHATFLRWRHDDQGATAIEYGLIVTGITVAIAAIIFAFGDNIKAMFVYFNGLVESRL